MIRGFERLSRRRPVGDARRQLGEEVQGLLPVELRAGLDHRAVDAERAEAIEVKRCLRHQAREDRRGGT
jgi:hypothetical protein